MKDPEFIELRNKFLIGLGVVLLFCIPLFIFIFRNFNNEKSDISKELKEDKSVLIFIESNDCSKCSLINDALKEYGLKYYILNSDRSSEYEEIITSLDLDKNVVVAPAVIYVQNGEMYSNIVDINNVDELDDFMKNVQ